ncbi:MAG: DNA methyltransferase [Chthoniobacter sp.]
MKSSIAADLIERYSQPGDLVVDPFAGAGTIPLEAALRKRRAYAADISPYARILSIAKLHPPDSLESACLAAEHALNEASELPKPNLTKVPAWIRQFYHPETLREAIRFSSVVRVPGHEFLMACFLGILHHQRPGFLSFPSSHLVPYLRDKKYPRGDFPELYQYRDLRSRLFAKIARCYKRFTPPKADTSIFHQTPVQQATFPKHFDALITSPPYMNALDYGRDNRLRLWFIDPRLAEPVDNDVTQRRQSFRDAITSVANHLQNGLRQGGYGVFVVGEEIKRSFEAHPSEVVSSILKEHSSALYLEQILTDKIPDVRRTRRECNGVKTEHFLVFKRN